MKVRHQNCSQLQTVVAAAAIVTLACILKTVAADEGVADDLAGDYCAKVGCCTERRDEGCSAPILGTMCYCDDFCYFNRTGSNDCCPDFMSFCKGVESPPPEPLQLNPKPKYTDKPNCSHGEVVNINCNECRCRKTNENPTLICNHNECLIDPSLLEAIKNQSRQFGWSAKNYSEFWGKTYDDGLKWRLGTLQSPEKILQIIPLKAVFHREYLKSSFDLRKVFGDNITNPIDQGWCGASWAISTVQVITDRFVIMTKGLMGDALSSKHLLSCNLDLQRGCQGGHLTSAWNWIRKFGLVTEECYPWDGRTTGCEVSNQRNSNNLIVSCPRSAKTAQLRRVGLMYRVATKEGIMYEIMNWGSVQAMMKVSKEFFMYESGVYKCSKLVSGSKTGYHAVRIVGWGEEQQNGKTVEYWIVSNSWGLWWGENGYFRILKGTNECQIEEFVVAAMADIGNFCNVADRSFREKASYTLNGTKIDIS
ncbi:hypothetical protein ACI65C_011319 [Semiaphis heraclei]